MINGHINVIKFLQISTEHKAENSSISSYVNVTVYSNLTLYRVTVQITGSCKKCARHYGLGVAGTLPHIVHSIQVKDQFILKNKLGLIGRNIPVHTCKKPQREVISKQNKHRAKKSRLVNLF